MEQKRKTDIDKMVMGAHYLNAIEKESKADKPLSDMERQDYIDRIAEQQRMFDSVQAMLNEYIKKDSEKDATILRLTDKVDKLSTRIEELTAALNLQIAETEKYKDRNARDNKEKYSGKSKKSGKNKSDSEKTRQEEKDDYDGTEDPNGGQTTCEASEDTDLLPSDAPNVEEEPVKRGSRDKEYAKMGAAKVRSRCSPE